MVYRTPVSLPVRFANESGRHIENEFLFGLYERLFVDGKTLNKAIAIYYAIASEKKFPNHIKEEVPEKEISHDQLTAYSCYSYEMGCKGHRYIWRNTKNFKFEDRYLHPRDYIYYGILNNNVFCIFLMPLLILTCLASMFIPYRITQKHENAIISLGKYSLRHKLSGELLWVLRYEAIKGSFLYVLLFLPIELIVFLGARFRYGGINEMFMEYFKHNEGLVEIIKGSKNV
jgi:hypothetical protein